MAETVRVRLTGTNWPDFDLEIGSIHVCYPDEYGWKFADREIHNRAGSIYQDGICWTGEVVEEAGSEIEVEHPSHYNAVEGMPEVWDILDAFFPGDPLLWQAGKYLLRAGRKNGTSAEKDLEKLEQYSARRRAKLASDG